MKGKLLIALCSFFILTNCSLENDSNKNPVIIRNLWNLVNVSGGIAGVDDNFELGTIVWTYNESTSILTITNSNDDDNLQDSLDSGTYTFSILDTNNKLYIVIDNDEFGSFTLTQNAIVINRNELSTGNGADAFILTFEKTVEIIE